MEKVVLVTGASAGIGLASAARLKADGWTVVGASRRGSTAPGCDGLVMDVDDDASVAAGVGQVGERYGGIDALVTCAGWGLGGPLEMTPLGEARAQLETNFWGTVRAVQAVLPGMRERRSGRVVLLSSIGGAIGLPFQGFYSASKFAVEGMGESLWYELKPFGIKVTIVQPGNIRTDFTDRRRLVELEPGPAGGYLAATSRAISVMERDERNGAPAEKAAAAIARALSSSRPPLRVSVGKASERAGLLGKRALPFRLFQAAARSSLGA